MIIKQRTLITLAAGLLLAACSSSPTNQNKGNGRFRNGYHSHHAANEQGAVVGKMAQGDQYEESEGDDVESVETIRFTKMAQFAADNKCVPAKPIGGVEQHFFFDFDKDLVSSADIKAIKTECNYLLKHPDAIVRVEGNADDRGSREYNVALAARRASAIIQILKQQGVSDKQIQMVSYGAEKPAALGENESAYHCNRRVDFVFKVG